MSEDCELRPYQACRTAEGWTPITIHSESQSGLRYLVLVCPWGVGRENICECPGYFHRGQCKHQLQAMDALCGWTEFQEPARFIQTPEQRKAKVCPRCGGPTLWRMEVVE
jgi:hypothetical protein